MCKGYRYMVVGINPVTVEWLREGFRELGGDKTRCIVISGIYTNQPVANSE